MKKYRPSAAEAMAEAEIQEIEGGQDAVLSDAEPEAKPEAKSYGWADEDRYFWDDPIGRMIRWPVMGRDDAPPYGEVELEEGEPAYYAYGDSEDQDEDQDEDRKAPFLDDDERLMVRSFARALMATEDDLAEAVLPPSKRYPNEWLKVLLALHDDQMQMDAAARVYILQTMLGFLAQRPAERVKPTWSLEQRVGAFERWKTKQEMTEALEAARVRLSEEARALLVGLERMGWVPAEVCLDQHGKFYKARFSNGTSAVLDQGEIPVAQLLEGRIKSRMEAAFKRKIPAPCPNPAPVGLDKNEPVPDYLVSAAPPSLTQIPSKQQPEKPGVPMPERKRDGTLTKRGEKLIAERQSAAEKRDASVRSPGPKRPQGGRSLVVVLGSGSRSTLPARAEAFYRDQATRGFIEDAKRAVAGLGEHGAGWGVADEVLGWAEPDALMVPPDKMPSEARKAELVTQTAQAIYRKALQAGAKFVDIIGPQGRYRDDLRRALQARGIEVGAVREKQVTTEPKAPPNPVGATCLRESWSPDPNVRMWGERAGDGGGACPETLKQAGDNVVEELIEKVTALYMTGGVHKKVANTNAAALVDAILTKKWSDLLHPDNKVSRVTYKTLTGISLPHGVQASKDAFLAAHHPDAELMLWGITGHRVEVSSWCEVAFHGWLDDLRDEAAGTWGKKGGNETKRATLAILRWAGLVDASGERTKASVPSYLAVPAGASPELIDEVARLVLSASESQGAIFDQEKTASKSERDPKRRQASSFAMRDLKALYDGLAKVAQDRRKKAVQAALQAAPRVTYIQGGKENHYRIVDWSHCETCGSAVARIKGEVWTDSRVDLRCIHTGGLVGVELGGVVQAQKPCTASPDEQWAKLLAPLVPGVKAQPKPVVPRPPAYGSQNEDDAVREVKALIVPSLSAGELAQRLHERAPYLRVEAPDAQTLRIGPDADPFELLLFPNGSGGRAWVHFDPDADPRHPGNEHLRRLPLDTLIGQHGAITNPYELARHIITEMAHEPQEPGLHVAQGAAKALPEPKPQEPVSVFTLRKQGGWGWSPGRNILFSARRAAHGGNEYILEVWWLLDDGPREYSLGGFVSLQDAEKTAKLTATTMSEGYEPMMADGAWRQISGKPVTEATLALTRKGHATTPSDPPDPSHVAQTIWDGVVAEVAKAYRDPERVRRVAAKMQATMVAELAALIASMIAKAKAKGGAR